jgi:hypothetical protein
LRPAFSRQYVFASSGEYVGTCGLSDTRRAIGEAFPTIAKTLEECLPERRGFDPAADIPEIVRLFSEKLQAMGGEEHLMQPVGSHVVQAFRGFSGERLQFRLIPDAMERQREVQAREDNDDAANAINDPTEVKQGDLLVFMRGNAVLTNPGHVAVVESYAAQCMVGGNMRAVEATGASGANPKLLDSMYLVEQIIPKGGAVPSMILVVTRHGVSGSRVCVIRV